MILMMKTKMTMMVSSMSKPSTESIATRPLQEDRFLRFHEVHHMTGLCRAHIHGLAKEGKFPKPIKLTPNGRASGWLLSEVQTFIAERVRESRK